LLVNPYDIDGVAHALRSACEMPIEERLSRFLPMYAHLKKFTVHRWTDDFLSALMREPELAMTA
jgi:trehalose 6-phosphate synthase